MNTIRNELKSHYREYKKGVLSQSNFALYISTLIDNYDIVDILEDVLRCIPIDAFIKICYDLKFCSRKKEIKSIGVYINQGYCGGMARVNAILINIWIKLGYRVVVFSDASSRLSDFEYSNKARRIVLPRGSDNLKDRLKLLKRYCLEEDIDVYVSHCWLFSENVYDWVLLRTLGIYYINYAHGLFTNIFRDKSPLHFINLFKLYDLTICLSEVDYDFYTSYGIKAHLVPNPISDNLKKNNSVSSVKNNIISIIGRLDFEKQPLDSLKAFKNIHKIRSDIKLNIVGDGDPNCVAAIKKYIAQNNLSSAVSIHSNIPKDKIADFYIKSDCLLFTSYSEGYPMVILEACCYGVPVCMYELPYLALTKNNNGVISSKHNDINDLSNKLIELMNNEHRRIEAGQAIRQFFLNLSRFNYEKEWSNIFMNLIHSNASLREKKIISQNDMSFAVSILINNVENSYIKYINITKSKDYKIGFTLCFLPRKIIQFLRKTLTNIKKLFNVKEN